MKSLLVSWMGRGKFCCAGNLDLIAFESAALVKRRSDSSVTWSGRCDRTVRPEELDIETDTTLDVAAGLFLTEGATTIRMDLTGGVHLLREGK